MTIRELNTNRPNPYVTVTLSYDEVRDICNGLYERCEISDPKEYLQDSSKYRDVYKKAATLFDLVKHGKITSSLLYTLTKTEKGEE